MAAVATTPVARSLNKPGGGKTKAASKPGDILKHAHVTQLLLWLRSINITWPSTLLVNHTLILELHNDRVGLSNRADASLNCYACGRGPMASWHRAQPSKKTYGVLGQGRYAVHVQRGRIFLHVNILDLSRTAQCHT